MINLDKNWRENRIDEERRNNRWGEEE